MKKIQVLGTGCAKCDQLAQRAETAAKELGLAYRLEKVKDLRAIAAMGVMMTPALVVDDIVKVSGRVPGLDELKKLIA